MSSDSGHEFATGGENNAPTNNVEIQDCITIIPLDGFPSQRPPDFHTPNDMRVLNALKLTWQMTHHTWEPEARQTFLRLLPKATSLERRVGGQLVRHPVARDMLRAGTRASWAHYVILRHLHASKFWKNIRLMDKLETEFPDVSELRELSDWHEYIFKRQYRNGADDEEEGRGRGENDGISYEPVRFTEQQRRQMEFSAPEPSSSYRPSDDSDDDTPLVSWFVEREMFISQDRSGTYTFVDD